MDQINLIIHSAFVLMMMIKLFTLLISIIIELSNGNRAQTMFKSLVMEVEVDINYLDHQM